MCGIVGYIGPEPAADFLLEGLRRLEYRGYDSAGLAVAAPPGGISLVKTAGRIDALAARLDASPLEGRVGIGHTRWATHGPATAANAHPHFGGDQVVAIAHNGVIENFRQLKQRLEATGYRFRSDTDSEVIAHLVAESLRRRREQNGSGTYNGGKFGNGPNGASTNGASANGAGANGARHANGNSHALLVDAVSEALAQLRGTYGLVMLLRDWPDVIVAARLGSPLVVGVGHGEHLVASDASPLAGRTDKIVYLADHQLAVVTADDLQVHHRDLGSVRHQVQKLDMATGDVELDGHAHYMLKEIFEQPESLQNSMRGRIDEEHATAKFGGLNLTPQALRNVNRIVLTACGTSWHAALVGEYVIEQLARIPVEVEYASELRYRNPPVEPGTLLFAITQSGETADTLAALREMKRMGHPTLAICNVVGSSIAHEADGGVYLHAGPEVGVASTKAYTSQVLVLTLLALYFGRLRHLSFDAGKAIIEGLHRLPGAVRQALQTNDEVRRIAEKYYACTNFLYLGRQYNFPTALEGALKLKEISYIHAEGYPAAEMKHGPIALVDEHTPSVFIVPQGFVYEKVMSNLEEIKARGGPVIAVVGESDTQVADLADDVIRVPEVEECLQPMVSIVPLQLLAYHVALLRGCDVDKPRNLAKSVTVE